jgi:hypothetical protein
VRGKQASLLFFSDLFIVHRHSDFKVPFSNLNIDKRFYLEKKMLYNCFCFAKYTNDL